MHHRALRLLVLFVSVTISSVAVAKPDLVVTNITISPASPGAGSGTITATIKNQGDEGTCTFCNIDMKMYLDGKQCDTGIIIAGLGKGSTATEDTTSCNPATPGAHVFKIVVDTEPDVDESNESNNSLEKTFTWAGPDLVVTNITVDPATPTVGEGTVTATIKNQGPVGTSTFLNIDMNMFIDGVKCDTGIIIAGLGAGSTATEDTTSCNPKTPGPHTVRFEVDTNGEVAEMNEANNALEKTLTWAGGPDLVVTSVTIDPATPKVGSGTITATIKNQGDLGTGFFVNVNLKMFVDGKQCDTGFIVGGLGAGSTTTEDTTSCNVASAGPHTFRIEVDTDGDVLESNENNNAFETTLSWYGGPDLVITDITLDPAVPTIKNGTLTAKVKNQGDQGTGVLVNINLKMFLDGKECDTGLIVAGLGKGSTTTEDTSACNPKTPGPHVIRFEVDTEGDVPESNEANNALEKTFTWEGGPDLVITKVVIDPGTPKVTEGTITATVANVGQDGTGAFVNVNLTMYLDGAPCDTGLVIGGLGAGSTTTETTTSCNASSIGPHVFRIDVDTAHDVDEANEANNTFETTLAWYGGPDLIVKDLTLDPAMPKVGEGTLTGTILNQGDAGTGLFVNVNVRMLLDGVECDTGLVIGGLGAGSKTTEDTTSCNPTTPGPHVIRYEVDTEKDVAESNEANNALEKTLTWTAPNLVVSSIALDPKKPEPGGALTATATLKNVGTVDTDNAVIVNVSFFLDNESEPCATGLVFFGLDAGAETTEVTSACVPATVGPHALKVVVDTKQDVVETDESDNSLSVSFSACTKAELCNGIDDTCEGTTDEGFGDLGFECDGPDADLCAGGKRVCTADGTAAECVGDGPAKVETCNGKDDDCDTETDEGFTGLGEACDGPDTDLCVKGKRGCSDDGTSVVCVEPGEGKIEACNGKDETCDGKTDEGFDVGTACVVKVGDCEAPGTRACSDDGLSTTCQLDTAASVESCDGKDNDCNGKTDDGIAGLGAPCVAGSGACRAVGKLACGTGALACDAVPGIPAGTDACGDGLDDDCDGLTDEGCECSEGAFLPCGSSVGACALGVQHCLGTNTYATECTGGVGPQTEACGNAADDDCDGSTDEGCTCTGEDTLPCGVGACDGGAQHCIAGAWSVCAAAETAIVSVEQCNAIDDDCDGVMDPGCPCTPASTVPCPAAPDACATYVRICGANAKWLPCKASPGSAIPGCGQTTVEDAGSTPETPPVVEEATSVVEQPVVAEPPPGSDVATGVEDAVPAKAEPSATPDPTTSGTDVSVKSDLAASAESDSPPAQSGETPSGCATTTAAVRAPPITLTLVLLALLALLRPRRAARGRHVTDACDLG